MNKAIWLLVGAVLSLSSCGTARLARLNQACGVSSMTWTSLAQPPGNADELISKEKIGPPSEQESQHWFAASSERLLLCRVDSGFEPGCATDAWVFQRIDGQWRELPDESWVTVCTD